MNDNEPVWVRNVIGLMIGLVCLLMVTSIVSTLRAMPDSVRSEAENVEIHTACVVTATTTKGCE
jgi:hypothetical protein